MSSWDWVQLGPSADSFDDIWSLNLRREDCRSGVKELPDPSSPKNINRMSY